MTQPRILITGKPAWFEKDSHSAISFYRIVPPLRTMERTHGIRVEESASAYMPDIFKSDIVFLHTPVHDTCINAVQAARMYGKKVWLDFDDMIFANDIPRSNLAWTFFNSPKAQQVLKACIPAADAISVSTETIKERIIELFNYPAEKIWVIPNAFPDELWATRRPFTPDLNEKVKKVMWRGSVTHEGDLYRFRNGIKPHKNLGYLFVGHLPWILHKQHDGHLDEISYHPWEKPLERYWMMLKDASPHYVLVALEECDFNRGKSNIAWLEATFAGAACIAQSTMPEFDKVPTIQFSSVKSLDGVLKNIASGTDLRTEKYMESRALIEREYLLSVTNQIRWQLIEKLMR